jgi:hypothetical protein
MQVDELTYMQIRQNKQTEIQIFSIKITKCKIAMRQTIFLRIAIIISLFFLFSFYNTQIAKINTLFLIVLALN